MSGWWDQTDSQDYKSITGGSMELFAGMIPEEESLDRMIASYLETVDDKVPRSVQRTDGFHASSAGGMCVRLETFKRAIPRLNDRKVFPGALLRRFQLGHAVHDRWQSRLLGEMRVLKGTWECSRCTRIQKHCFMPTDPCPKCRWQVDPLKHYPAPPSKASTDCAEGCKWPGGYYVAGRDCVHCRRGGKWLFKESGVRISSGVDLPGFDVVGSYDGIALYNGVERILELKTKDAFAWPKVSEPMSDHVIQAQVYMWGTGIHEAVICYINKNSGEMKEFLIPFDPDVIDRFKKNIERVYNSIEKGQAPNGPCSHHKEKRAKECPFRDVCFQGIDDLGELAKLEQEKNSKRLPVVQPVAEAGATE